MSTSRSGVIRTRAIVGDMLPHRTWRAESKSSWSIFPGGARVPYSPWGRRAYTQQLLMLEGRITVHIDLKEFDLFEGDCLDFDVMRAVSFENPRDEPAKYIVIVRHK